MKTEPVTGDAIATQYVWFVGQMYGYECQFYTVASATTVTGSVFCGNSDYFWDIWDSVQILTVRQPQ